MLESLFNNVVSLKSCSFIRKRLQHRCFLAKFAKFLRTPIFYRTLPLAASGTCNIMLPLRVNSMLNLGLFRSDLFHFMHNLEKWLNKSEGQVFWWPFHFSEIILCYSGFPGNLLFCHCQNIQDLVCSSTSSRVLMKD